MSLLRRRPVLGAFILISLIATAALLRIGLEWRQALHDIDSMIVTPAVIPLPTDTATNTHPVLNSEQVFGPPSAPVSNTSNHTVAHTEDLPSLSQRTLNILLLGTDARPDDTEPTRTDAIVVVRLDRDSGRVSMLSIPRDLWVSYPSGGEGRINAAYAVGEKKYGPGGGAALAKSTVGKLIGVNIDQFVLINFEGFKTLIDRLDGIVVDVPVAISDPAYPTDDYGTISVSFEAGPQMMDGERALIYARTRHADNDFGRNQRQQLVLMSIFNRILDRGLLEQLTSVDDYTGALRGYVQTDMSRSTMLALVGFARDVNINNVLRYAIDSSTIVELSPPATFAAEPRSLRRIVAQFTGDAVSTAGGE